MLSDGHTKVHYGNIEFTYDGKEKAEFVEWTEKNINDEITVYLQCNDILILALNRNCD